MDLFRRCGDILATTDGNTMPGSVLGMVGNVLKESLLVFLIFLKTFLFRQCWRLYYWILF